jgi:anti-sigma B factor antagonist
VSLLPPPFAVTVTPDRTSVRVVPSGELDVATCDLLAARLDELWTAGWTDVVLDLRALTFIDSSGLHLLIDHHRRACAAGARFSIIDGSPPVRRVLRLCGLHEVLVYAAPERVA